jgi:hypothetical protein
MKKLLLFTFLLVGFVANATYVQVTFNEGFYIQIENPNIGSPSTGNSTTDTSINSILFDHNVYNCIQDYSSYPKMIIFFNYSGTNISNFVADLNNNGNVFKVGLCYESPEYYFPTYADILIINLVDLSNGNPIGINSNGNVLTNNTLLNEIFETFNVKKMVQEYPTSVCCLDVYSIHFDGDIEELKNALDNLDSIIEYSFFKEVMMLLSNKSFEKLDIRIYPNPFQNNFTIETEKTITNYSLFDLTGKKIIETFSKNEIDNFSSQLNSGVYFLNLEFENGQKTNHKLIKE